MRIVFTAKGMDMTAAMDPRFGRTAFFVIYDEEREQVDFFDNRAIEREAHGAGPKTAQKLSELGAEVLITGNGPGGNAAAVLNQMNIAIYTGAGELSVREAYAAYKAGKLPKA